MLAPLFQGCGQREKVMRSMNHLPNFILNLGVTSKVKNKCLIKAFPLFSGFNANN